jgi:small subunit ribosomal protein S4
MGDPKRLDRKYDVPRMKWNKQKIKVERDISDDYGLRRKKELWKADTEVRSYRKRARLLLAGRVDDYSTRKDELLNRLIHMGIFTKEHKIEDVLKLNLTDYLDRRLQTLVFKKGLALTPNQARQLITHGHIAINGKVRKTPGSIVYEGESISYNKTQIKDMVEKMTEKKGKPVSKDSKKTIIKEEPVKENVESEK